MKYVASYRIHTINGAIELVYVIEYGNEKWHKGFVFVLYLQPPYHKAVVQFIDYNSTID